VGAETETREEWHMTNPEKLDPFATFSWVFDLPPESLSTSTDLIPHQLTEKMLEDEYFHFMEEFRLGRQRGWMSSNDLDFDPSDLGVDRLTRTIRDWHKPRRLVSLHRDGPKPIDLRAWEIIVVINRTGNIKSPKVLAEIIKHKDALHPYMLKRLQKTLRTKACSHREQARVHCQQANHLDGIADQLNGGTA
jgi:hypothetical protein